MATLDLSPSLSVVVGAAFVLVAALVSRVALNKLGIPSIVTLLGFGLAAGPSGLDFIHLNLVAPETRALLQLAVVVVLFEATLRMDLRGMPKLTIALLVTLGAAMTIFVLPAVARAYHLSHLLASMIAALCVVTGPTVIGPLMARLRPRTLLSHLLESEGLILDALGVIIAAAAFAAYTSRYVGPLGATLHVTERVGAGVVVGLAWGLLGRIVLAWSARSSSDVSKMSTLFLGFASYASAEWVAHESGLVAVVVCGLLLDFRTLPHERVLRAFKEDLSMLALSTVFVLLASQIQLQHLGTLLGPAAAIVGALVVVRVVSVAIATWRSPFSFAERILMAAVFPRGIVAISLATYYATQIPAWGMHGGDVLAGLVFLVVVFTIAISTPLSMLAVYRLHLQMPAVVIAGITPATLETARRYKESGHLPILLDADEHAVALARSHDLEAVSVDDHNDRHALTDILRERRAKFLVVEDLQAWDTHAGPVGRHAFSVITSAQARSALDMGGEA